MIQPGITFEREAHPLQEQWRVPQSEDLPFLNGVTRLSLDTENSSKNPFTASVCGVSIGWRDPENLDLKKLYCPVGHIEGNMDPEVVRNWLEYVLPGKEVIFANAKYDIQVLKTGLKKKFGLDLEALGVKPRDVAFPAALLDDSPYVDLSLEGIAQKYVGQGKLKTDLDMNNIANYPSFMVGPYGEQDALITYEADENMGPLITAENLDTVTQLEYDIIYAVCEIERNGCRIDVEKLELWRQEVRTEYEQILFKIKAATGYMIEPGKADHMTKLFHLLGLTPPVKVEKRATGKKKKSGKVEVEKPEKESKRTYEMQELLAFRNPVMNLVVEARRRKDLLSRFLDKYHDGLINGDLIRAQFHQLKTAKDEEGDTESGKSKGVAWGRFSSSGGKDLKSGYTFNAQQVIRPDKQMKELGDSHIIRELFIPDDGQEFGSCDAKQIEYRILAALANAKMVIDAYKNDPSTDYHELVHVPLRVMRPDIDRTTVKNANFGFAFEASARTTAITAGISIKEAEFILAFCRKLIPERDTFSEKCSREAEHRGYVCTILGRRARFKEGDPFYRAINRVIQGSAADVFKMLLRDLYREHKSLGITKLRQIVHDEFNFDFTPGEGVIERITEFMDQQRFPLKIPIAWEIKSGRSWRDAH